MSPPATQSDAGRPTASDTPPPAKRARSRFLRALPPCASKDSGPYEPSSASRRARTLPLSAAGGDASDPGAGLKIARGSFQEASLAKRNALALCGVLVPPSLKSPRDMRASRREMSSRGKPDVSTGSDDHHCISSDPIASEPKARRASVEIANEPSVPGPVARPELPKVAERRIASVSGVRNESQVTVNKPSTSLPIAAVAVASRESTEMAVEPTTSVPVAKGEPPDRVEEIFMPLPLMTPEYRESSKEPSTVVPAAGAAQLASVCALLQQSLPSQTPPPTPAKVVPDESGGEPSEEADVVLKPIANADSVALLKTCANRDSIAGAEDQAANASAPAEVPCGVCECSVCEFVGDLAAVEQHTDGEHGLWPVYECFRCGILFWKASQLKAHVTGTHGNDDQEGPRGCITCGALLDSPEQLNNHIRTVHAPHQPIFCRFCGVVRRGRDACERHAREKHFLNEFRHCEEQTASGRCSAFFRTEQALADHMRIVHGKPIIDAGGSASSPRESLHVEPEHPSTVPSVDPERPHASEPNSMANVSKAQSAVWQRTGFACGACGLRHNDKDSLRLHLNERHRLLGSSKIELSAGPFSTAADHEQSISGSLPSSRCSNPVLNQHELSGNKKKRKRSSARGARNPELAAQFHQRLLKDGFTQEVITSFREKYAPELSENALRIRAYRLGFKLSTYKPAKSK